MKVLEYQHRFVEDAEEIAGALVEQFPSTCQLTQNTALLRQHSNLPALLDYGNSVAADIQDVRRRLCAEFGISDVSGVSDAFDASAVSAVTDVFAVQRTTKQQTTARTPLRSDKGISGPKKIAACSLAFTLSVLGVCAILLR